MAAVFINSVRFIPQVFRRAPTGICLIYLPKAQAAAASGKKMMTHPVTAVEDCFVSMSADTDITSIYLTLRSVLTVTMLTVTERPENTQDSAIIKPEVPSPKKISARWQQAETTM